MYWSAQVLNGRIVGVCPACPLRGRHPVTGRTTARTRPCVIYCCMCTVMERVVPNCRQLPTIRHCRLCPLALNRHHGDVPRPLDQLQIVLMLVWNLLGNHLYSALMGMTGDRSARVLAGHTRGEIHMDTKVIYSMVGVGKTYPPGKQVLRDISLSYFYGAKIGVIGLNGAGKS